MSRPYKKQSIMSIPNAWPKVKSSPATSVPVLKLFQLTPILEVSLFAIIRIIIPKHEFGSKHEPAFAELYE